MQKSDKRKSSPEEQHQLSKQVVHLRLQGKSNIEIAEATGYCYSHISSIWGKYAKGILNLDASGPKVRGRRFGDKRKLTEPQGERIKNLLIDHSPAQLGLSGTSWLWTTETIRLLIEQVLLMDVPKRTISEYRKRWGFLPQKPTDRAPKQDHKLLLHWLKTEYKKNYARIRKDKAEIHWFDYADIKSGPECYEGSLATGRANEDRNSNKGNIKMLSTITNRGKFRFMLYRENIAPSDFYMFLERLIKDCKSKVFLILYNHQVHHSKLVNCFLEAATNRSRIEFFYIPSNLPEHNPVEKSLPTISMDQLIKAKDEIRSKIAENIPKPKIIAKTSNSIKDLFNDREKFRTKNMAMIKKLKAKMK